MEDKEYLEEAKERKEEDRAVSEEAEKKPAKDDDEYEMVADAFDEYLDNCEFDELIDPEK